MLKFIGIKAGLTLSLGIILSCSTVKSVQQQDLDQQLLKDVEILSSDAYQGRKTDTKGAEMARAYLKERFNAIGIAAYPGAKTGYEQDFSFDLGEKNKVSGKNIIGYLGGKKDSVIVISAHYDHLGIINNQVFNGADDNASGVAALLKCAAYFAKNKPEHTLIFAAFDAEEMGLQGAKAFVAQPPVALAKIKLNVNMDMISHNDKGELYACGTYKYPQLKQYFFITNPNIKILFGHDRPAQGNGDWTNQSDQGPFNDQNIPFIYFGVEDHKDYHKATDDFERINKTFFNDAANAILEVIINIDKDRNAQKMAHDRLRMKKQ